MLRPGAPSPDDEVGEYFSQFYESVREDKPVTWRASTPAASCATPSTAPARSRSTPRCRRRSCSSSASTSACTPCSASCTASGNYRTMAEELWPFVQGPPSTPMAEAEQPWLRSLSPQERSSDPPRCLEPQAAPDRAGEHQVGGAGERARARRTSRSPRRAPTSAGQRAGRQVRQRDDQRDDAEVAGQDAATDVVGRSPLEAVGRQRPLRTSTEVGEERERDGDRERRRDAEPEVADTERETRPHRTSAAAATSTAPRGGRRSAARAPRPPPRRRSARRSLRRRHPVPRWPARPATRRCRHPSRTSPSTPAATAAPSRAGRTPNASRMSAIGRMRCAGPASAARSVCIGRRINDTEIAASTNDSALAMNATSRPNTPATTPPTAAPIASIAPHSEPNSSAALRQLLGRPRQVRQTAWADGPTNDPSAEMAHRQRNPNHRLACRADQQQPGGRDRLHDRHDPDDVAPVEPVGRRTGDRRHQERRQRLGHVHHRHQDRCVGERPAPGPRTPRRRTSRP